MATPAVKNVRQVSAPKSTATVFAGGLPVSVASSPASVAPAKSPGQVGISPPETMQLQVDLGDLYIKQVSPSNDRSNGDEMGDGDEPAWTTFRGRLRIDGNSYGNAGFTRELLGDIGRIGNNLTAGSVNRVPKFDKTIEWLNFEMPQFGWKKDYGLKVFDPSKFWEKSTSAPNLEFDVAVGGVVYWEVDNNKEPVFGTGGKFVETNEDLGVDSRRQIVDLVLNWLGDGANEFASSLAIPFNYQSYLTNARGSFKQVAQSFGNALTGAFAKLGSGAGATATGVIKTKLNDYLGNVVNNRGTVDRITGIHLMIMVPVTTSLYVNLQSAHRSGLIKNDIFEKDALITTKPMFDPDGFKRTSTWLTLAVVPNGQPGSSGAIFETPVGGNTEQLTFRGGYDSVGMGKSGWLPNSEIWTASVPGIKAGNIWTDLSQLDLANGSINR